MKTTLIAILAAAAAYYTAHTVGGKALQDMTADRDALLEIAELAVAGEEAARDDLKAAKAELQAAVEAGQLFERRYRETQAELAASEAARREHNHGPRKSAPTLAPAPRPTQPAPRQEVAVDAAKLAQLQDNLAKARAQLAAVEASGSSFSEHRVDIDTGRRSGIRTSDADREKVRAEKAARIAYLRNYIAAVEAEISSLRK